jgi:hypothetical protein
MTIGAPSGGLQYLFNTKSKGTTTKINKNHEKYELSKSQNV